MRKHNMTIEDQTRSGPLKPMQMPARLRNQLSRECGLGKQRWEWGSARSRTEAWSSCLTSCPHPLIANGATAKPIAASVPAHQQAVPGFRHSSK